MRPDTLREILLVKAIEESDRPGQVIPWGERERAARDGLRFAGLATDEIAQPSAGARVAQALADRARRLNGPLLQRYPVLGDLLARSGWPTWVGYALLAVAFVSGFGLSAMNESRRINILALPFLGLLAWNLVVYLWVTTGGVRQLAQGARSTTRFAGSAVRSIGRRLGPLVARTAQVDVVLGDAVRRFVADWSRLGAPILAQRMRQWLHLAAAALALGLIAGLYQRGIGHAYVAGWESTWLAAPQVKWLIDVLFGPPASWAGIALPKTLEEVAQLQFRADGSGGSSAGPWIHVIALCLLAAVVLPRLVLAAIAWFKAAGLQRASGLPADLSAYAMTALGAGGQGLQTSISVFPYAYEPGARITERLEPVLQEMLGRGARPRMHPPVPYGAEAALAPALREFGRNHHGCVILMNLASTPETENHGLVLDNARELVRDASIGAPCRLLVDEASYADRFAVDGSLAGRLDQRRRLWQDFAARHGIEVAFLPAGPH
jgi:hypothetical protein